VNFFYKSSVLLLLLFSGAVFGAPTEADNKKQLALLRERMLIVEQSMAAIQHTRSKEERELQQLEKQLGSSSKKLRSLNKKLNDTQEKITQLKQQQTVLQQGIVEQKKLLAEQLNAAFLMGRQQRVKLLLNQEQPDRMSRVMQYYDYFNQARLDSVASLEQDIQKLSSIENKLLNEQRQLSAFVGAKKQESLTLQASKKKRKAILTTLANEMAATGRELQALKENEKRLTKLLASIRRAITDIPVLAVQSKPFDSLKGSLPWPIKGQIRKKFGSARKAGRLDGVLIDASEGTNIRSISHGRVVYADWLRGYGLLIIVDHGSDYLSLYAFNESLYKDVGEWVGAGETIATVGLSGGQPKAGLYFSIRKSGKPVNPVHWCRAAKRGRVG
jgi:septal ring factor EnvC (AmiA/AmiB activator)